MLTYFDRDFAIITEVAAVIVVEPGWLQLPTVACFGDVTVALD